ncbi:MAG: hypothetical protein A3B96_01740 [Candidatus Spechtbacteria bacterium RIFCSPHIGHO2_02_FULL_43_15b]|uniref:Uncharacterized protein n=1 Tax=Candidatus Spechtbacteria bacterium RIFCSPHIGHO2_01_FULL_43_30 TaxID=1802158 RepID=A0A1G2H621_9BACT|nr:MAG: hypothetical protein A2827_01720 [Candidatus Spechtbacteria bacterium RIFCSPHIGHO2_01_FULL_43_30]OGZ60296.1 MAG: hypothetical protein A3B96_01740 [Candidatus Spechtbacteria bacterium RIFCSPHIGHO2_02_FULL_43_15b]
MVKGDEKALGEIQSEIEELDREVKDRIRTLENIINSAQELLMEFGSIVVRDVFNSHTKIVRKLYNFGKFSFDYFSGMSMFGGDRIAIWYNYTDGNDNLGSVVLDVYWQKAPSYQVTIFADGDWVEEFYNMIKNKDRIADSRKRAEEKREEEEELTLKTREKLRILTELAKRLQIKSY